MSTVAVEHAEGDHGHVTNTGLSNEKLAMWTFLGSECLLFGGRPTGLATNGFGALKEASPMRVLLHWIGSGIKQRLDNQLTLVSSDGRPKCGTARDTFWQGIDGQRFVGIRTAV